MATIIGQSGAWQTIVSDLARRGHSISTPRELPQLAAALEETRPQLVEEHHERTQDLVRERSTRIDVLAAERGFFRRVFKRFKIRSLKIEIAALYGEDSVYSDTLDGTIVRVRSLLNSAELAGAEAELSVIACLRLLSPAAMVFNDVRLHATRHIHFNGAALMSAQIDHVVLTPAGVFVIETKRWSERFVESGAFHNPFNQVSRANYLCYDLLRERFGKMRVRSILVCVGTLFETPSDSYIKVIRPEGLVSYISGFWKVELTPERFDRLRRFFEDRVVSRTEI